MIIVFKKPFVVSLLLYHLAVYIHILLIPFCFDKLNRYMTDRNPEDLHVFEQRNNSNTLSPVPSTSKDNLGYKGFYKDVFCFGEGIIVSLYFVA